MNDIFLSIEYNRRQLDGIEEFKSSLDDNYLYQIRPKWIPACSEGAELWITVFINSGIGDFLKAAILGGAVWDIIKISGKKYIFNPLFNSLEKLNKENMASFGGLKVLKFKLQFDDCEILIGGLNSNFTSIISTVVNEVSKKKPEFEREVRQKVIKIELPIDFIEHLKSPNERFSMNEYNDNYSLKVFKKLWKVTFSTEFPVMIYSFKEKKLYEPKVLSEILKTSANIG